MVNMSDLLGALSQSGLTRSTNQRMKNALGAGGSASDSMLAGLFGRTGGSGGGLADSLARMFGRGGSGGSGGGVGKMIGQALEEAKRAAGGNRNLAVGGIGALTGALFGGGGRSVGGALGGGLLALLGAMGYSALKKGGQAVPDIPKAMQEATTPEDKQALEHEAGLVVKAMINAAKADGHIDRKEIERISGKLGEMGIDSETKAFVIAEMRKPMDTDALIDGAAGNQALGAQLYAASLLAIEVDTPAEQAYMEALAQRIGLHPDTVAALEQTVGMQHA